MRRRITIEGDWRHGFWNDGDLHGWRLFVAGEGTDLVIGDVSGMEIEVLKDPLPTRAGTRFYGQSGRKGYEGPRWWFVMSSSSLATYYQPDDCSDPWDARQADLWHLVELPKPEEGE